jgi:hypothetical protein
MEFLKSRFACTVNSRFKKDLKLQIHLHKTFFSDDRFIDSLHKYFLNQINSRFKKGKMDFLKSRVYCTHLFLCNCRPTTSWNGPCVPDNYGFADVIDKSLLFYEVQRSGDLPESEMRVKWRKDSALDDHGKNGEDLTGGYYDGKGQFKFPT